MDNYVEKGYPLEVVSGLSQGVLGLKNLCAYQKPCNTKLLEARDVQMASCLFRDVLELKISAQIIQLAILSLSIS